MVGSTAFHSTSVYRFTGSSCRRSFVRASVTDAPRCISTGGLLYKQCAQTKDLISVARTGACVATIVGSKIVALGYRTSHCRTRSQRFGASQQSVRRCATGASELACEHREFLAGA